VERRVAAFLDAKLAERARITPHARRQHGRT
jgi:hypothetical protein